MSRLCERGAGSRHYGWGERRMAVKIYCQGINRWCNQLEIAKDKNSVLIHDTRNIKVTLNAGSQSLVIRIILSIIMCL